MYFLYAIYANVWFSYGLTMILATTDYFVSTIDISGKRFGCTRVMRNRFEHFRLVCVFYVRYAPHFEIHRQSIGFISNIEICAPAFHSTNMFVTKLCRASFRMDPCFKNNLKKQNVSRTNKVFVTN